MNVTCPQCTSVFRVDPAKVPIAGVRARCSVCSGLIAVRRPAATAPVLPPIEVGTADEVPTPSPTPAPPRVEAPPPPPPVRESRPIPAPPPAPVVESRPPAQEPIPPVIPPSVAFTALPVETPPAAPPSVTPSVPPAPSPAPPAAGRFANPFLQQDPATRARRLARALVSDLVVYHPEKRQRGLTDGTLKELFSEEIRKSWEEYSEQVGEELATSTPWFTEALNEILAEGRPLFG